MHPFRPLINHSADAVGMTIATVGQAVIRAKNQQVAMAYFAYIVCVLYAGKNSLMAHYDALVRPSYPLHHQPQWQCPR